MRPRPCRGTNLRRCSQFFREGGRENLRALLRRLAGHAGIRRSTCAKPQPVPRCGGYLPGDGAVHARCACGARLRRDARSCRSSSTARRCLPPTPRRSMRFARRLRARGLAPAPLMVPSLKDPEAGAFVRGALERLDARGRSSRRRRSRRAARGGFAARWRRRAGAASGDRHDAARGLAGEPARARARRPRHACGAARARRARALRAPSPSRMRCRKTTRSASPRSQAGPSLTGSAMVADRIEALGAAQRDAASEAPRRGADAGLSGRRRPRGLRRRPRRAGRALSRFSPTSPKRATCVAAAPQSSAGAARSARSGHQPIRGISLSDYRRLSPRFPARSRPASKPPGATPEDDPDCRDGAFRFRAAQFGNVLVALPPERGRLSDRRAPITTRAAAAPRHARLRALAAPQRARPTRSCIWARTARSNGCRGRPWR